MNRPRKNPKATYWLREFLELRWVKHGRNRKRYTKNQYNRALRRCNKPSPQDLDP